MTIASAIATKQQQVADAYTAISSKGGTLPATQDIINMPTAINSIPTGGGAVISTLTVTPTTSAQTITASGGVDGFSPVNVSAVTASIDPNITAENIASGVTILGVTGSATLLNGESVNITPTTSAQTITPTSPANGITVANVSAVTSTIDPNILPENIKKDVSILNCIGTLEGGGSETVDEWVERVTLGDWVDSATTYTSKGQTATVASGWNSGTTQTIDLPNVELLIGSFTTPAASVSTISMPKLIFSASTAIISAYATPSYGNLTQIELPELLYSNGPIASYPTALTKIICPKLVCARAAPCQNLSVLEYLYVPSLVGVGSSKSSNFMTSCPKIRVIYLRDIESINNSMTGTTSCADFDTLVLAGNNVVPLTNASYITSQNYHPKFYNGTGSIYVPDDLVDSYKAATNWSTIASMIKKLSTWVNPYA